MGEVYEFPRQQTGEISLPFDPTRSCFKCRHYASQISFCVEVGEVIDSELFAARDCDAYDPEDDFTEKDGDE